jgi:hypothetical protein
MADQKSLRRIGFGLSAVTALVTLVATLVVTDAARNGVERPAIGAVR